MNECDRMRVTDDLDDIQPEAPLPFWLKAIVIVLAIPITNTIFPGTVAGLATYLGFPDPAAHQAKIQARESRGK